MKISRSVLAGHLVVFAVWCAFFVSGATLNNLGLNYSTDTSSGGLKLHPYTFFTTAAVLVLVSGRRALSHCLRSRQFRVAMIGAALTVAILVLKATAGAGQSLGFAVDTIVAAFLLAAVLPLVPPVVVGRLSVIALSFVVIECTLAMVEAVTQTNLIPIDTWYGAYFRATALHGHPLNNALVLVTVATALQVYARRWVSVLIFMISVGALIAFGGRGALAAYLLVNAICFARFGLLSAQRALILMVGSILGVVGLSWLILSGLFGDRLVQVGAYDDSSQVRVQSLEILPHLNWPQILFGNNSDDIVRLMDQANVGVIENFLVGYLLTFGLVLTGVIFYCVYKTCAVVLATGGRAPRWRMLTVLFVFTGTALTNNSLVTKTPALYLLIVGLWCASSRFSKHVEPASLHVEVRTPARPPHSITRRDPVNET
jgi:hypothetical protein